MDLVVGIVCTFILVLCLAGTIGYRDCGANGQELSVWAAHISF